MGIRKSRRATTASRLSAAIEPLESRMLLTVTVNTFTDEITPGDGLTSLREALAQVATLPGNQTIDVPAGTYPLSLGVLSLNDLNGTVTIQSIGGGATIDAGGTSAVIGVSTPAIFR